jgi:hypothetical protein
MKAIRLVSYIIVRLLLFFLLTVPGIAYGVLPYFIIPLGWLIRLFVGRPILSYKAGIITLKLSTIILLIIIPSVLYLYVSKLLGVLFFAWIGLYLLIRIYSGVHKHEREVLEASKRLEDLTQTTYTKYYVFLTTITIILSIVALAGGYLLGREIGLWVGVAISILIWIISPFARETINKK